MRRLIRRLPGAVAIGSLLMLGWHSYQPWHDAASPLREITLWTAGASAAEFAEGPHAALPDATNAPASTMHAPDVAYLRRAHPGLERIRIAGDGVDAAGAMALRDRTVNWQRPVQAPAGTPELVQVAASRILGVGQRMWVQGRIRGLSPGAVIAVSLEGPDGDKPSLELHASADGDATFSLASGTAAVAPGAFEWQLRVGPHGAPLVLGAWVTPLDQPRVLILQAAPTVEGGRLQRWLAETGAAVTMRTRVSAEHLRFGSANAAPTEFPGLTAGTLAAFDVVVAGEPALLELKADERANLMDAITRQSLGLLVLGGSAEEAAGTDFSPWPMRPGDRLEAGAETRLARLRLHDGRELAEPIPVPPAELEELPSGRWLVRDPLDRLLGAAAPRGRGWVARTLVTDTWRWLQSGHPEIYAAYWSAVLSAIARPANNAPGQWSLESGTGPLSVGEPVRIAWTGAPDAALPVAEVRPPPVLRSTAVRLALARDPRDPARGQAVYYPAHPGWHEVAAEPSGPAIAFYVLSRGSLSAWQAERRRDATARLVGEGTPAAEPLPPSSRTLLASWAWFVLFVTSAGWRWWDERRRAQSADCSLGPYNQRTDPVHRSSTL